MKRRLPKILLFLTLGLATTLAVSWLMALLMDVQQGRQSQAESFVDDEQWTVTRWDRAGAAQINSVRTWGLNLSWSPQQAAGPPNTPTTGDQGSAWASKSQDSGTEWLILEYAKEVIPRRIDVYENYAPGALFKVTIFDSPGQEIEAWSGNDPSPANPAATGGPTPVSAVSISLNIPTKRVKIYLASDKVPGWNEIDAVGLVSDKGEVQWAKRVTASSTYASGGYSGMPGNPELLAPSWTGLDRRSRAMENGDINREERMVDARGWPMLALRSQTNLSEATKAATALPPSYSAYSIGGSGFTSARTAYPSGFVGGSIAITTPSAGSVPVPVPLRPIWIGLIGDTIFFALIWFGLWAVLVIPRRFVREVARFRRGGCVQCGYDLGYDFINGCPECGWRRDHQTAPPSRSTVSEPMNGD